MREPIDFMLQKEELKLATLKKRSLAYLIDELLLSIIVILAMSSKFDTNNIESFIVAMNQAMLFVLLVKIIYHALFTHYYGATIGKIAVKIRVVSIGLIDNPTLLESLLRASMRTLGESLFYIGLFWAFFDPNRQGWHDKLAKTLVIDATQ